MDAYECLIASLDMDMIVEFDIVLNQNVFDGCIYVYPEENLYNDEFYDVALDSLFEQVYGDDDEFNYLKEHKPEYFIDTKLEELIDMGKFYNLLVENGIEEEFDFDIYIDDSMTGENMLYDFKYSRNKIIEEMELDLTIEKLAENIYLWNFFVENESFSTEDYNVYTIEGLVAALAEYKWGKDWTNFLNRYLDDFIKKYPQLKESIETAIDSEEYDDSIGQIIIQDNDFLELYLDEVGCSTWVLYNADYLVYEG